MVSNELSRLGLTRQVSTKSGGGVREMATVYLEVYLPGVEIENAPKSRSKSNLSQAESLIKLKLISISSVESTQLMRKHYSGRKVSWLGATIQYQFSGPTEEVILHSTYL